jgi:hypothetical protein
MRHYCALLAARLDGQTLQRRLALDRDTLRDRPWRRCRMSACCLGPGFMYCRRLMGRPATDLIARVCDDDEYEAAHVDVEAANAALRAEAARTELSRRALSPIHLRQGQVLHEPDRVPPRPRHHLRPGDHDREGTEHE